MVDVFVDEGGLSVAAELCADDNDSNARLPASEATPTLLTVSTSFREGMSNSRKRALKRSLSLDADDFLNLMHQSNSVKVELNRLENEVMIRDKDQELGEALAEIKALKFSERLREKTCLITAYWILI